MGRAVEELYVELVWNLSIVGGLYVHVPSDISFPLLSLSMFSVRKNPIPIAKARPTCKQKNVYIVKITSVRLTLYGSSKVNDNNVM